ncbi:MAG: flagellar biosynthetic protein FliQ [Betaproteobacteria bacterium]|nr:flagellar biosynthetic protein FliQ [Betaproteobacteria bacterium]
MNPQATMTFLMQAMELMLVVSAPLLVSILAVGLAISVLQAATQVNEATLSFIPKLIVAALVLIGTGPWLLAVLVDYLQRVLTSIPTAIG